MSVFSIKEKKKKLDSELFWIQPDYDPDIYHMFTFHDKHYIGICCVPSFSTSQMLNSHFRIMKENNNLDALEESDTEEEIRNPSPHKYFQIPPPVDPTIWEEGKAQLFHCQFHESQHKWVPISKV